MLDILPSVGALFGPMDILADLQQRLRAVRPSWEAIGERTGVSVNTIRKIAYGDRKNPQLRILEPLLNDDEIKRVKVA